MSRSDAEHATAQPHAPVASRTFRLRTVLAALVVVALAPAVGTAVFAISQSADAHRQASASQVADTARALAHTIESELASKAALLQAMGAGIGSGGIALAQAQSWLDGLRSGQGRFVLSALQWPPGEAEPQLRTQGLPLGLVREALASGGVSLSNLFTDASVATPVVALSVPLASRPGEQLLLSLVSPAGRLMSLAPQKSGAPDSLLVAVVDGTGRIVARSRDGQRMVGQPARDWDKLKALGTPNGRTTATTTEGHSVIANFETLGGTPGWMVVIAEPRAAFDRAWQEPLAQLAAGSALAMLVGLLVAAWLARAITRPVHDLARNALAVACATDGAVPPQALARPTTITEFEALRHGIEAAQGALHARAEAERRNAKALALNELRYRMLARTGAVVLWRAGPDGALRSADGWEMLTGDPDASALGQGWRERVHPEDQRTVQVDPDDRQLDIEFRVSRRDGSWCWVRGRGTAVPSEDGVVREWVGVLEDVSERHAAQARIAHMALHDALTDLPNRVALRSRLELAILRARRGDASAVLYIDLDRFKAVNDTLGHAAGDALLLGVAARLRALVRADDAVARLSGDEFAIIESRLASPRDAAGLAARVIAALSAPYDIAGQAVHIGASVGIMLVHDDRCDVDHLLKCADMALYRAKQEGRGRYSFFEPELDARMQARRSSEQELREALAQGAFALRYTPLVDRQRRRLRGVSAALHWEHAERGLLPHSAFDTLADELGLSGRLVQWMLQRLCADLAAWPGDLKAALDVSAALRAGAAALCGWVDAALADSGTAPGRLELEIAESALMAHPEAAGQALQGLRARGVRVTLSHVGSERSALGLLRALPFDKLKIAHAMLQTDAVPAAGPASVRAVALLCAELDMLMGAEGVENDAQLDALPALACLELQGPLFGSACTAAEIPALFRDRSA
ncbi:EAL domain-containing protein [Pseudorhodoferax sp. Leaf267]|uniref:bifunctional diguanylate cyclase/phosphodiesterase n=1 Tax=Pseudorhodoferax sp. Leaf267 TaxID=1736316 RepID=UPI0006F2CBDE|nr:EAL domain-containing protein [Pseudorhodoferax sp. Leaf267]KQP11840.1 hypothetical protein ASF43_23075 [Pseudorhodoferax sp. Leaf267]